MQTDSTTAYRESIRRTFQHSSDYALAQHDARVSMNDCVDRQELNREIQRRIEGGTRIEVKV